jgi:phage tail-like protein
MPSLRAANGPANRDLLFPQLNFEVTVPTLDVVVGFFTQVQGLSAQLDVLEYQEGGRNDMVHKLPSRIKQGNITLKVGLTREGALLTWFQASVVDAQPADMSITLLDSLNNPMRSWSFAQAYPVKWTASDFNAGGNEVMTETLEVAHQGMKPVPVAAPAGGA